VNFTFFSIQSNYQPEDLKTNNQKKKIPLLFIKLEILLFEATRVLEEGARWGW